MATRIHGRPCTLNCEAQASTPSSSPAARPTSASLATVLGAVDWGYRVILVTDALCSSADETHDSMLNIYMNRFGQQVECVTTETLLATWSRSARAELVS